MKNLILTIIFIFLVGCEVKVTQENSEPQDNNIVSEVLIQSEELMELWKLEDSIDDITFDFSHIEFEKEIEIETEKNKNRCFHASEFRKSKDRPGEGAILIKDSTEECASIKGWHNYKLEDGILNMCPLVGSTCYKFKKL